MPNKSLIPLVLLAASTGVIADSGHVYGRVVTVKPNFVISLGSSRHHSGYRILYEVSSQHYWTHSHYYPGHVIWVPTPIVHHVHHHKHHSQHGNKNSGNGWYEHRGPCVHHGYHHR